jgi:hypothetical protein
MKAGFSIRIRIQIQVDKWHEKNIIILTGPEDSRNNSKEKISY